MNRIGVKYCGGCNPHIDRPRLVREIVGLMPPETRLVAENSRNPWDAGILVCGCPVACADRPEVRRMARRWIRVGGETVDLESVPEGEMARFIAGKLKRLKQEKYRPRSAAANDEAIRTEGMRSANSDALCTNGR